MTKTEIQNEVLITLTGRHTRLSNHTAMFKGLIEYEEIHEWSPEMFGFGKVTVLRKFGPWKPGQTLGALWFNVETGVATEYDMSGERELRSAKFSLVA